MTKPFCIYAITHVASGRRYIGSSVNHIFRWVAHKSHLRGNRHHCRRLQKAWNKHGESAFLFEIVEPYAVGTRRERIKVELKWIKASKYYNSMQAHLTRNTFENSPHARKLISISMQKLRTTPEARRKQSKLLKAAWADPNSGIRNRVRKPLTEAILMSKAEKMRIYWASPEGQIVKARRAEKLRAYWADPASKLRNRNAN
jgi:group I intron endonuclease